MMMMMTPTAWQPWYWSWVGFLGGCWPRWDAIDEPRRDICPKYLEMPWMLCDLLRGEIIVQNYLDDFFDALRRGNLSKITRTK